MIRSKVYFCRLRFCAIDPADCERVDLATPPLPGESPLTIARCAFPARFGAPARNSQLYDRVAEALGSVLVAPDPPATEMVRSGLTAVHSAPWGQGLRVDPSLECTSSSQRCESGFAVLVNFGCRR